MLWFFGLWNESVGKSVSSVLRQDAETDRRLSTGSNRRALNYPHADKSLRLALAIPRSSVIEAALQSMEMSYTFRKSSAMNLRYQIENRAAAASTVAVPFSRQSLMTVT